MGLKYWLNERRQIVKFYKDIYKHYFYSTIFSQGNSEYDASIPIPKIIHYAWFGRGEMNALLKKCMATWNIQLKDYKIILWNEDNFPFDKYPFAKQAYEQKKYAFVADVARLHALYNYGGIYMDTDCEVIKSFDDLLNHDAFACYETPNLISIGTVGAKKGHPWLKLMMQWYDCVDFSEDYAEIANTRIISRMARLHYGVKLNGKKLVLPNNVWIYPREWFLPEPKDGKWLVSDDTYVVHHFTRLW